MKREQMLQKIDHSFESFPIVALLGPRQCGKTTLARMYWEEQKSKRPVHYFDLEDETDLAQLETPKTILENLEGLVIIDEIQLQPKLFPLLRVLADRPHHKTQFLMLGSASQELINQSSESLAGRVAHIELTPFQYQEVDHITKLWLRGGFPLSYLAKTNEISWDWRKNYVKTFLERDIPQLGIRIAPQALRRFWMMLVHYHGQIFNASEIGRSLGISDTAVRHYLDILIGTFMMRYLQPWFENINKRQVKSPKIYMRDSGLLHFFLGVEDHQNILHHPKLGASWEGFALEEVIRANDVDPEECFFWGIHGQSELDLLIFKKNKRLGFEFKFSDAPRLTPSLTSAFEHLNLDQLLVIYPGKKDYTLNEKIKAVGLENYLKQI
jgi:uncharacterized protein